ncbi:MAG: hypothetical protein AB1646_21480 [Thermodesulfobacteriota bacterium]
MISPGRQTALRVAAVAVCACVLLGLSSCRSSLYTKPATAPHERGTVVAGTLRLLKSALLAPFQHVDHVMHTRANVAQTMVENRVRPATSFTNRRCLTLDDCRALALANNLDLQVARLNELTKKALTYSNKTKLLPHFLFTGDLSERNNQGYSYSEVIGSEGSTPTPGQSGTGVTSLSHGHERSTWRYVLETRWSPTDAALAYYLTRSAGNDSLKAHYQKLRVAQKLLGVVEAAFFRLLALQDALPMAENLAATRVEVATRAGRLFRDKFADVQRFQQAKDNEVKGERLLSKLRNEMERQRNILASAMGLSPDYCVDGGFYVAGELKPPCFVAEMCEIELKAVQNRPEAYEAGLNHLNSVNDLRRTVVKYLPKPTGFWRYTRDKDKFLWDKEWNEVGLMVYFDFADWLGNFFEHKAAWANQAKAHKEIATVALGITSQVRLAALKYFDAGDELASVRKALGGTTEVLQVAKQRRAMDDLDRVAFMEATANNLMYRVEFTRATGEANATLAELNGEMGINYFEPPGK